MLVVTSLVSDVGPCISVLEVKFIELFKNSNHAKKERTSTVDEEQTPIISHLIEDIMQDSSNALNFRVSGGGNAI